MSVFGVARLPVLLFLIASITGLDPLWRHRMQKSRKEAAGRGNIVIFSSHVLSEVAAATHQVIMLNRGRLAAQGDAREIRALIDKYPHRVRLVAERPRELGLRLIAWDSVESVTILADGVDVTTSRPGDFYARLTAEGAGDDLGVNGFSSPDDSIKALFETLVR